MNMREIKFRAWDGRKMFFVNVLNLETDTAYEEYYWYEGDFSEKAEFGRNEKGVLMQFTGLHDKNGKEIYEGDVVVIPYIDPMGGLHTDTPNGKAKVGFENGQFVIYRTEPQSLVEWCEKQEGEYVSNYGFTTIINNKTVLEVIGNIHEHSHLLT